MVDLWVAEEDGSEGPAHGYNSHCSVDHNRTSGLGCAAGRLGIQTDHGYEDALFAGRVQDIIQRYNQSDYSYRNTSGTRGAIVFVLGPSQRPHVTDGARRISF